LFARLIKNHSLYALSSDDNTNGYSFAVY